jgi:hypothetical protein
MWLPNNGGVPMSGVTGRIEGEKGIYIHNDLGNAAFHFRNLIEKRVKAGDRDGIAFDCMACLMMCAFEFESYLNFIGHKQIEGWDERQKYDKKLKRILKHLDLTPDQSVRPYSSLKQVKDFRDLIAHGKPEETTYSGDVDVAETEARRHLALAAQ